MWVHDQSNYSIRYFPVLQLASLRQHSMTHTQVLSRILSTAQSASGLQPREIRYIWSTKVVLEGRIANINAQQGGTIASEFQSRVSGVQEPVRHVEASIRSKTTRRIIFNAQGRHTAGQNVNMTERKTHRSMHLWVEIEESDQDCHTPIKVPSAEAKTCELISSKGLLTSTSSPIETIKGCPREHFVLTSEALKLFAFNFH